ncbi:5'-methylthioadenosine/adenosylhomocysteine nucleosidase [Curvivirga sp.]|uniref:5'-methylthioadenosine/adenosylhomocysteine nucleosidase n=1 Tax=Curvivirga sp. TaxID=2856848 RepID=UPI003B5BCCCF
MTKPIGIISAIPEEIKHLLDGQAEEVVIGNITFYRGEIEGEQAVFVETGIGKVNAAIVSTLLVSHFDCRALMFSGVAGGLDPKLNVGDVVIGERLVQHDYGKIQEEVLQTFQPGAFPLPGVDSTHGFNMSAELKARSHELLDEVVLETLPNNETPSHHFGAIVTGDAFINCEATRVRLHKDFKAMAVEMEGAAVVQVAEQMNRPWVVVRCLSDLAGSESHMDFDTFLAAASINAARVTRKLVHLFG